MFHVSKHITFCKMLQVSEIVSTGDLAWDWINEKLYWTDSCYNRIEVYEPTTGYRKKLFETSLIDPFAIVVDPSTR